MGVFFCILWGGFCCFLDYYGVIGKTIVREEVHLAQGGKRIVYEEEDIEGHPVVEYKRGNTHLEKSEKWLTTATVMYSTSIAKGALMPGTTKSIGEGTPMTPKGLAA